MEKGDKVLLKGFENRPYVRCIWEERQEHILICSEQDLLAAKENGRSPVTPGVVKKHCFKYDVELFTRLQRAYENSPKEGSRKGLIELWERAEPFSQFLGRDPRRVADRGI